MKQHIDKVYLTDRFIIIFGENLNTEYHSHHALQLGLNLNGEMTVNCEDHNHSGDLVVINSNRKHAIKQSGLSMLILLDSELVESEEIRCTLDFSDCYTLSLKDGTLHSAANSLYESTTTKEDVFDFYNLIFKELNGAHKHEHILDERIDDAIRIIKSDISRRFSPEELADEVFLSLGRFQHLFKEQTGTTLSKFLLWQRTLAAIKYVIGGSSFTDAAVHAGFSDGPHFSRLVKRSFGLTMSDIINNENIEVITF